MPNTTSDPCIPYGRGGAGNMRRRSSIVSAWAKIAPTDNKLVLTSSPDEHYPRLSREDRRRANSAWSSSAWSSSWSSSAASTAGTTDSGRKEGFWGRVFGRREKEEKGKGRARGE